MRKLLIATFFIVLCLGFYALVKAEDPTDPSKINTSTPPKEQVYKFLAPLGDGFSCMSESGKNEAGEEGRCVKGGIGSYLNTIFMLLIGIAGVLSVVMIIVHSIQYMGDESVFGKTEAKAGIKSAIFGLLIALGAYALLNTINPALTGKDGVSVDGVEVSIEEQQLALFQAGYTLEEAKQLTPEQIKNITITYKGRMSYIKNEYIPARDKSVVGANRGALALMTAQASFEGFYPETRSYKTNNPGNIGNTEKGSRGYNSLSDGIKAQYEYITKVANNKHPSYKINRNVKSGPITEAGVQYPGIDIIYNGSLEHYLWTYAAGTRPPKDGVKYVGYNNYLSYIISFFKKEGLSINPKTTIKDIYNLK